ncbi:MAG: DUF5700 domain-containing putative Zn-dependent protease [Bacteroidota bacterium]
MKKISLLTAVCVLFSCHGHKESTPLVFNFEQAERFMEVMDHLEAKESSGFSKEKLSDELIDQHVESNRRDVVLNRKIDTLLSLSVYNDFSETISSYVKDTSYKGREAYRTSFLFLPKTRIDMSAGMSETWATFWEENHDAKVFHILNKIKSGQKEITKKSLSASTQLLPKDFTPPATTEVIFCFDSNRGSFTTDSQIFMEMFSFARDDFSIDQFTNVLSHELHHIYFGYWFTNQLPSKFKSEKQEALFNYMEPIIFEGIAQQINYDDYSDEVKSLYKDSLLIGELFQQMTTSIRKIASATDPHAVFEEENNKIWSNRMFFLNKYLPNGYKESTFPFAPTVVYYIGYHLYNSILQKGGKEKLNFVIENSDCLLEEYNKIYSTDLLIPTIPDDMVKLWKETFKKAGSNIVQTDNDD